MSWELREGDCLDPVTGLASLADKSVDHVICDPPYEAEAPDDEAAKAEARSPVVKIHREVN